MSRLSNGELRAELSRRAFLNYGVALGALGFAAPSLLMSGARAATAPDGEVLTGSHWGAFRAKVEGGRMVSVKPWEKDPAPSHQLAGVLDSVYSPTRIKYPMVRRAYLEKGPGRRSREPRNGRLRSRVLGPGHRPRRQGIDAASKKPMGRPRRSPVPTAGRAPAGCTTARACSGG